MPESSPPSFPLPLARSPELLDRTVCALLVIDVQERLLAVQPDAARLVWNVRRMVDGAAALGVPTFATEQLPDKLGPTTAAVAGKLSEPIAKSSFSAACDTLRERLLESGARQVVLVGIETHVCVAQTALDLVAEGLAVYVPVDAVGARFAIDHRTALRRLEGAGVTLTTTEAALFEWCASADDPAFRAISALAKEVAP